MTVEGGCFCGAMRYRSEGQPAFKGQCYCRQCQYFAGGGPNIFMAVPAQGFLFTKGTAARFARQGQEVTLPATREFCPICGVHLVTLADGMPDIVFLKVGTLDDPAQFGGPELAIFTCDRQSFQPIPEGIPTFDKMPPAKA